MNLRDIIETAANRAGNHQLLAKQMCVSPNVISDWKAGRKACSLQVRAHLCELAGMTNEEIKGYVWEVVRERMGKLRTEGALGVAAWIGFMAAVGAQLAAAAGDLSATMYRRVNRRQHCKA